MIQGLQNSETKMMDGATWMAATLKSDNQTVPDFKLMPISSTTIVANADITDTWAKSSPVLVTWLKIKHNFSC